jgi:hypothetical protein
VFPSRFGTAARQHPHVGGKLYFPQHLSGNRRDSGADGLICMAAYLGSGPVDLAGMAFEMARDTRKSLRSGVVPPVEGFDAADRSHVDRPPDRADLHGLACRKALKGFSLPAPLLRASAQIRSDHSSQINRS